MRLTTHNRSAFAVFAAFLLSSGAGVAQSTVRVSVSLLGGDANGPSARPSLSYNGLAVAFESTASNLVAGDANLLRDVFVRDVLAGTTVRASVATGGAEADGVSDYAAISGDGRFVAFRSAATNLVAGDTNGVTDIFVHDLTTASTERASVTTSGEQLTNGSATPFLSADGRWLAFAAASPNLGAAGLYLRDRQTSITAPGIVPNSPASAKRPWLSADGQTLAAWGYQPIGFGGGNVARIRRPNGAQSYYAYGGVHFEDPNTRMAAVSSDGRYLVMEHDALMPGDTVPQMNIYVRDTVSGLITCESLTLSGRGAGAVNGTLSTNGRFVAFESSSPYLISSDLNGQRDIFVRDRTSGRTARVSGSSGAVQSNGWSANAQISSDGRFVVFESSATNLVPGDTNGAIDIYLVDTCLSELSLYTYCTAGTTVHGCVPSIAGIGAPSSQATSGFDIVVSNVPGQRYGTLFYGFYAASIPWAPFSPSYQCIASPVQRLGIFDSGGSAGQCNGELRVDFNAWRAANPGSLGSPFVAGQVFYAQGWFRDPGAPKQTNLSDGLRFTLCD